jgi:hypothetical protein
MSVLVNVHSWSGTRFAEVIDMPAPNLYKVQTVDGKVATVHVSLIKKFF